MLSLLKAMTLLSDANLSADALVFPSTICDLADGGLAAASSLASFN